MLHEPTGDSDFNAFLPGMPQEDDRALIPQFFIDKKLMGAKSEAAGRQIYEDREYLRIIIKGQPHGVPVHEVTDKLRQKFPIAYARFKAGLPALVVGTPIEQLSGVGPSMAHNLKGLNLRTIEDLANVSDEGTINRIGMGARELVNRAKAWVEQKSPETVAAKQELEAERAARKALEAKMAEERAAFEVRLKALEKNSPRKKRKAKKAKRARPESPAPEVTA